MKPFPHFFAVFRFEAWLNPFLWFFPLSGLAIPLIPFFLASGEVYSSLSSLDQPGTMQFIPMMAAFILAPDIFGSWGRQQPGTSAINTSEFILTRAVDRQTVYASKLALFYLMALLPLLVSLGISAFHSDLTLKVWDEKMVAPYLEKIPESYLLASKSTSKSWSIVIPHGLLVAALYNISYGLLLAGFSQAFLLFIRSLSHRFFWFILFLILTTGSPIILMGFARETRESIYLLFGLHPFLFFGLALAFVLALQPVYFQKYRKLEFL